ncbi:MAG: terpene cyclase/mutase family protein, partial [Thermoguttaceae bacterium]|nr:terpene cyclase/mutase family protein [Thermoguttaceae bacterium]
MSRRISWLLAVCSFVAFPCHFGLSSLAQERRPVPSDESQRQVLELVREVYGDAWKEARTSEQRKALAEDFKKAGESEAEPEAYFVLLRLTRDIAAQAGEAGLAFEAIDLLAARFDVDAYRFKGAALSQAAKSATSPAQLTAVAQRSLELVDQAIEADDFTGAKYLAGLALDAARKANEHELVKQAGVRHRGVEAIAKAYADIQNALKVLDANPDDPNANVVVGRYYCLLRGDWERGLPMLALGSDRKLRTLAIKELEKPGTSDEQVRLADDWWDLSSAFGDTPEQHLLGRAAHWYRLAQPTLAGLVKMKVDKRLEELAHVVPARETSPVVETLVNAGFAGRSDANRTRLLAQAGGTAAGETAVNGGLAWLARNQLPDGSWSLAGPFSGGVGKMDENRSAATAMVLLAFQGAGNTHKAGKWQENVTRGWDWLIEQQLGNGSFFREGQFNHSFYTDGQCTIAVCELLGMTKDETYRAPAERAVQYLLQSQSPQGGWRYAPNSDSDVSVTAWIVTALVTARLADIDVPQSHFDRVMRYLDGVASHGGSRYPYQAGRESTLSMTAAAILCRQYIGWPRDDRRIVAALDWLTETENLVNYDGKRNVYYWYYATYACHHMG